MKAMKVKTIMSSLAVLLLLASSLVACTSSDDEGEDNDNVTGDNDGAVDDECPVVVKDSDCDKTKRPFVFVHGTFGSGDNIANVAMLFGSNGFCQDRFVAIEYNSLGGTPIEALDALVDKVLADTGMDKVELAGHSQGTFHCGTYMSDPARAAKVAHYIGYSGITVPAGIPMLAVSSNNDLGGATILPTGELVTQANLGEEDHFANAASRDAFVKTWEFLYGETPEYDTIQCGQDPVTVEGIAETFGDNVPVSGSLEVYELDYDGDPQERGKAVMKLTTSADGHFGPIELKRNVPYEFKAFDANGVLVGYVYFSPFKRTNRLTRLLKPSDNALIAGQSTDNIVRSANHTAIIGRYLGGAFRKDLENSLKVNGNEVLTLDNASRSGSVVGFFMYDANENETSDLGAVFGPSNFLVGTDVYIDATKPTWIDLEFFDPTNGNPPLKMKIPNWKSSEVLNLVYFQ